MAVQGPTPDRSPLPVPSLPPAPSGPEVLDLLATAARQVLRRRFRVVLLIRDAYDHLTANAGALTAVRDDARTALRLLVAWAQRSYRQVSGGALVVLVAALLYFIAPVDLLPDALGTLGFVDDVAVIQSAVQTVHAELERFREWEAAGVSTT
jgi:uncharacterized membrane protein YkvA (DUF1232 family)